MWLFLASECMFFGSLIGTFLLYRGRSLGGPYPQDVFNIPYTSVSSFVLLMSSLTMVLALAAIQRGDQRAPAGLAAGDGPARHDLHRRPGVRVHRFRPQRPHL